MAEDFLHQIDQQAADSLRKDENSRSAEELGLDIPKKPRENKPLSIDQLKKKAVESGGLIGKSRGDHSSHAINDGSSLNKEKESEVSLNSEPKPRATSLTDADWTELLSSPSRKAAPSGNRVGNVRGARREGIVKGNPGLRSNVVALEGKRIQKGQTRVVQSGRKSDVELDNKLNGGGLDGRLSDAGDAILGTSASSSGIDSSKVEGTLEASVFDKKHSNVKLLSESRNDGVQGRKEALDGLANEQQLHLKDNSEDVHFSSKMESVAFNGVELKTESNEAKRSNIAKGQVDGSTMASQISASVKKSPSFPNDEESDSESDSTSSSGSESEREREEKRKRRQQILAEKAAAKAAEAIKERENNIARLEGEKQSLEKILEERAKQQVLEASKLQTTTVEIMEAVELEKQKHSNTRKEALTRLAKLEKTNADLARSLASAQKNLEMEIDNVSNLRQQSDLKEAALEEVRRKISSTHQSSNKLAASKGVEFEREILEADYSFLADKVGKLQEKAKTLEMSIDAMQRELHNPSEMEIELKQRLSRLTDHLIQKQAQVESLSSEKAMLLFKIETVSRFLEENKSELEYADLPNTSSRHDLESGRQELLTSNLKPLLRERIRSGKQHLGLLVRQLDSIYCAGAMFLRRNSIARTWSLAYLLCLHLWVIYIVMSHSSVSDEARSGAVFALDNINNTGGV